MRKFKHLLAVAGCITCSVAFVACGGNDGDTDKKGNGTNVEQGDDSAPTLTSISGVELVEEAENIHNYKLFGNTYTLIGAGDNKTTIVHKFTDGGTVYETDTNNVWAVRAYKDMLIKEYENGNIYVFDYDGNILYSDKVFQSSKDGNRPYKDERFLNVDNNLVYLSDTDNGVVLKCIDMESFETKYEYAFDGDPIIMNKNLYLMSYYIGDRGYLINISTGQNIFEYDINANKHYLAGDTFVIVETEQKNLVKFTQYDVNGTKGVEKTFGEDEYIKIKDSSIVINYQSAVSTGNCFMLSDNSIVDSSFTTLVSKEEGSDIKVDKLMRYSMNYADVCVATNENEYQGYVILDGEAIAFNALSDNGAEIFDSHIRVMTTDGRQLLIFLETGKYVEIDGDLLEVDVFQTGKNDNYKIISVTTSDGKTKIYNNLGDLIHQVDEKAVSNTFMLSESGDTIYYVKEGNVIHYHSIKDNSDGEFTLTETVKRGGAYGIVLGKYYVYSVVDGNKEVVKAVNMEDGQSIELYSSETIENVAVTDYGFVVKDADKVKVYRFK